MTHEEEAIIDAYLSPHRLSKAGETPARPQPETSDLAAPLPYYPTSATPIREAREAIARALARKLKQDLAQAWQDGRLDTWLANDVVEFIADDIAGMFCDEPKPETDKGG